MPDRVIEKTIFQPTEHLLRPVTSFLAPLIESMGPGRISSDCDENGNTEKDLSLNTKQRSTGKKLVNNLSQDVEDTGTGNGLDNPKSNSLLPSQNDREEKSSKENGTRRRTRQRKV